MAENKDETPGRTVQELMNDFYKENVINRPATKSSPLENVDKGHGSKGSKPTSPTPAEQKK